MPIRPAPDVQGAAVLTLHGECDAYDEPLLAAQIRERIAAKQPLIVDFSHASFVDSVVLGSLLAALREAEAAGVALVLYLPERSGAEIHRVSSRSRASTRSCRSGGRGAKRSTRPLSPFAEAHSLRAVR